jgi:hypothetical protein
LSCKTQRRAVQIGDGRRQTEAKPVARRCPAALQPVKPAQHMGALVLRDARPLVGDAQPHRRLGHRHGDRAARRGVAQGVFHQIGQHLPQQHRIALHHHRMGGPVQRQRVTAVFGIGPENLDDRRGQRGQIHRGQRRPAPAFDLRDGQQRLEDLNRAVRLGQHLFRKRQRLGVVGQRVGQPVQVQGDALQRRLQVMGDVRRNLPQRRG